MLFNSYSFLIFFPIVTLVYYIIPKRFAWVFLLVASYYFYMGWRAEYALLLFFSTLSTWLCSLIIDKIKRTGINNKYAIIATTVAAILNLGILFYFKYFNFAIRGLGAILNPLGIEFAPPVFDIILPVGISFFTLQALGYLFDVAGGRIDCERNFFRYALFVSFFPQLVAGPIERSENLLPQLFKRADFDTGNVVSGLRLMGWGLFQKTVIADRIAGMVDGVFASDQVSSGLLTVITMFLFAIQIYCDFAGYSNIAIGTAQVVGIKLSQNFKRPYLATNFSSFWQRWHISLSNWLQDYIFTPICWSRWTSRIPFIGKFFKDPPFLSSILIVFIISGLWHGASFTFVLWGLLQGFYRVCEEITHRIFKKKGKKRRGKDSVPIKLLKQLCIFCLWSFSLIFFRAPGVESAFSMFQNLVVPFEGELLYSLSTDTVGMMVTLVFIIVLMVADTIQERINVRDYIGQQGFLARCAIDILLIVTLLVFATYGPGYSAAQFIYFQF